MSLPVLTEISAACATKFSAFVYLLDKNVIEVPEVCPECGGNISTYNEAKPYMFRCTRKRNCGRAFSILKNTFFGSTRLSVDKILLLSYLWLCRTPTTGIIQQLKLSPNTVCNWCNHLRQLVALDIQQEGDKIGGEGIIVEIDESKFGKRKFNQGHRVEGVWVVGGVERTAEKKMFAVSVANRSAETLRAIIEDHVHPGSIIYTDCWAAYRDDDLQAMGMGHDTVNHTTHFVDPNTGVHINTIEGSWNGIKLNCSKRHYTRAFVDGNLMTFIWRRKYRADLWNRLLHHAMSTIVYDADVDDDDSDDGDNELVAQMIYLIPTRLYHLFTSFTKQ
jgi:transposase-like protein